MEKKVPSDKIKCPLCAEVIQNNAIICKFCKSNLIGSDGRRISSESSVASILEAGKVKTEDASLGQAMLANLFWPGSGSWKLGWKLRGGVIFCAISICIVFSVMAYGAIINKEMADAMNEGVTSSLVEKIAGAGNGWWGSLSFLIYFYSFIDVYLIHRAKKQVK